MKKILIISGVFVLLIAAFFFFFKKPARDKPAAKTGGPSVNLLGTTNLPPRGNFVSFCLTNTTDSPLVCSPEAIERYIGTNWVTEPFEGKRMWKVMNTWIGFRNELEPNSGFIFHVPATNTFIPTRVIIRCQERAIIRDAATDAIRSGTANAPEPGKQFSGKRYSVKSPIISDGL